MFQIEDKFQILDKNSDNTFYHAVAKKDGKEVAIKKISFAAMSQKDKKSITEQVNLLRAVKSNYIVRYYDYHIDKAQANLYVIMEYCCGESLEDFLILNRKNNTYIEQKAIWKIFTEIVSAVYEIHNDPQGAILHRDIKPKNILLDKVQNVKLVNFSLLKRLNPEEEFALTSTSGTYYKSPEQIISGIYSIQSDIWALGCLLFQMATLRPPFHKGSDYLNAKSIKQQKVQKIQSFYSDELKRVINWCLQKKRQDRPTASMLKNIPQVNYRIRKSRVAQNKKSLQDKKVKIMKKQQQVKLLEERLKQLELLSSLSEDKENYDFNNCMNENDFY